jgi:YHS domain-containing protein
MRIVAVLLVTVLVAGIAGAGDVPPGGQPFTGPVADKSRVCMMQDSMQPKAGIAQEREGKRYWFCCPMCLQAFAADPARYTHARDPVTGALVDKADAPAYAVGGKVYFFSSQDTLERFTASPTRYLGGR